MQYLCNISRKHEKWSWFFTFRETLNVSSDWCYHFRCVWPDMSKLAKITSLLFLCNILRKKWVMKLIFCMQRSAKVSYKLILWFMVKHSKFPKIASLQCLHNISKKKLEMKLIFCMQMKITVSYQLISTLLTSKFFTKWYHHHWLAWSSILKSTQSNKFAISLQYLKKEVTLALLLLM